MSNGNDDAEEKGTGTTRSRSPSYPAFSLKDAVGKLPGLFTSMKRHAIGAEQAVKAMGLSYNGSSGKLALAAMRSYGLFANDGRGMVKLSAPALDILDYKKGDSEWAAAIKQAALAPDIHGILWERYAADLPSDDEIKRFLVRERKFTDSAVVPLIKNYKETIEFAELGKTNESDTIKDEEEEEEEETKADEEDKFAGKKKRKRNMSADTRADVYNLPIGDVVFERPARLSSAEIEDIEDWLKLLLRKIKREAAAPPDPDEEE